MSKLLVCLTAAGLGFGLSAAMAQDVKSDQTKAQGQEQVMQQKESNAKSNESPMSSDESGTRDRTTANDGRTKSDRSGQAQGSRQSDRPAAARDDHNAGGGDQNHAQGGNSTGMQDQNGMQSDRSARAPDQQQYPDQSAPSVGHPEQGAATGQFGEKKYNEQGQGQANGSESR
jgi:hypothetical protein